MYDLEANELVVEAPISHFSRAVLTTDKAISVEIEDLRGKQFAVGTGPNFRVTIYNKGYFEQQPGGACSRTSTCVRISPLRPALSRAPSAWSHPA